MTRNQRRFQKRDTFHREIIVIKRFWEDGDAMCGSGWIDSDGKGEDRNGFLHYWWESQLEQVLKSVRVFGRMY